MRALVFVVLVVGVAVSKDILVLLPFPGYSHTMPFMPIFKELGRRGHNLTMVTPFPQEPTPKGFNQITVPINLTQMMDHIMSKTGMDRAQPGTMNTPLFELIGVQLFCPPLTPFLLEHTVPHLPPKGSKFDLVIMEPFFCMEPFLAASHIYSAPVVVTLPMPLVPTVAKVTGNPMALSYIPNGRLPYSNKMTLIQRVWNTIVSLTDVCVAWVYHYPHQNELMHEYLPSPGLPHVRDLLENISLVLTSSHFTMDYSRPFAKNVLEVGSVSTIEVKPLSKDLEKFITEAKDGVILFSWGSHFEPKEMDDIVDTLMTTFSKIKQRVLFKWPDTSIQNKPDNVLIMEWFPQPSILANNNTVAFISHCGMNSIYEAAYFGIPVIGTPLFADQYYNVRILEKFGMAVGIDVTKLRTPSDILLNAINEVVSKSSYKENALKRMSMLRDRPIPPLDEAVYWIEYVMKYGGTHLQPFSRDMSWYSVTLLDVWTFIITITAIIIYTIYKSILMCISVCKKGSKSSKKRLGKDKKNK